MTTRRRPERTEERGATAGPDHGLTTRGRCLAAGGIAAIGCAFLLDERDLIRVGIAAVCLPLLALVVVFARRGAVTATRAVSPRRLRPGETGTVVLKISNTSRRRIGVATVTDPAPAGLAGGVRCTVPALPAGSSAVIRYPLTGTVRGRYAYGAVRVGATDPLGLAARRQLAPVRTEVVVVPRTVALSGWWRRSGSPAPGGGASRGIGSGDPDVRVRPYLPGDDIRTIHWRASARRDDLVVRTRQSAGGAVATVIVDHRSAAHAGDAPDSSLETAIELTASLQGHAAARHYAVRVVSQDGTAIVATTPHQTDAALIALADLTASADTAIGDWAGPTGDLVIAVTGALSPADVTALAGHGRHAATAIAFVVDAAGWGQPAVDDRVDADRAVDMLTSRGWIARTVRRGDDLAAAWRDVCRTAAAYARSAS